MQSREESTLLLLCSGICRYFSNQVPITHSSITAELLSSSAYFLHITAAGCALGGLLGTYCVTYLSTVSTFCSKHQPQQQSTERARERTIIIVIILLLITNLHFPAACCALQILGSALQRHKVDHAAED